MTTNPTFPAALGAQLDEIRSCLCEEAGRKPMLAPLLALIIACLHRLIAVLDKHAIPAQPDNTGPDRTPRQHSAPTPRFHTPRLHTPHSRTNHRRGRTAARSNRATPAPARQTRAAAPPHGNAIPRANHLDRGTPSQITRLVRTRDPPRKKPPPPIASTHALNVTIS